jgi:hypothetical protein
VDNSGFMLTPTPPWPSCRIGAVKRDEVHGTIIQGGEQCYPGQSRPELLESIGDTNRLLLQETVQDTRTGGSMSRIIFLMALFVVLSANAWAYVEIYSYQEGNGPHIQLYGFHGNDRRDGLSRPVNATSWAAPLNNAMKYTGGRGIKSFAVCPEKNSGFYAWTGYWAHSRQLGPQGATCRAKSIPQAVNEVHQWCKKNKCWVVDGGFYVTIRRDDTDFIAICDYKNNRLVEGATRWMHGTPEWRTHKACPKVLQ